MPIPALTADGLLPEGVHDCTLEEVREQFEQFQRTDARCRLFERLEALVHEARRTGFVVAIIVDGSFVTGTETPNDVDVIIVLRTGHDMQASLRPFEYNVVSKSQIRRIYRIDALMGQEGEKVLDEQIELFSRVRGNSTRRKGILRLGL
jgi:hypothetical protein